MGDQNHPPMNTPQDCIRYAMEFEEPPYPCIRVILSHGTFVDLLSEEIEPDNPAAAEMRALFSRAYAGAYSFTEADEEILLGYLRPYLRREWSAGDSSAYEGRFEWISADPDAYSEYDEEDETLPENAEPTAVLLTQCYTGDHVEANNRIFNWFIDDHSAETNASGIAMDYREADSMNPRIAKLIVSLP